MSRWYSDGINTSSIMFIFLTSSQSTFLVPLDLFNKILFPRFVVFIILLSVAIFHIEQIRNENENDKRKRE